MDKVKSSFLPGFYDGEIYTNIVEFSHTTFDEFNKADLKEEDIQWLKDNGFVKVNEENIEQLFFPIGTQFTKLTAGVLDLGDCWKRFALTINPKIKLLLSDGFTTMYEIFGVEEQEESDDEDEEESYKYAPSDTEGWFA